MKNSLPLLALALHIDYPDGVIADELEAKIAADLPALPGLDQAGTQQERLAVYAAAIEEQREDFVDRYGDAFGWEKRSEPREPAVTPELGISQRRALAS
jgi:hypothetical protein